MTMLIEKTNLTAVDYFRAKLSYEVTPWTLNAKMPEGMHLVLDVRDAEKFAAGHIPGAVNMPLAELPGRLGELPKDKTLVTYCSNLICGLAPRAALQLAEKGFTVQMLHGGLEAWEKNFPVERAPKAKKTAKRK
ncbi:MAG: rhodanese-like domain-containing protein [Elusimicrobia bacterium]|nr:rhodanese-like domain-containing protein [Elusimicrobiota bacterium]